MREIIPAKLWIGNAGDGRDWKRLVEAGVSAVVDVAAEETSAPMPRTMIYCRFPLIDGPQDSLSVLRTAVETVASLLNRQVPTLVCCGAGLSRSPVVAAAAICLIEGGSLDERLRQVVADHAHDISPQLWGDVKRAFTP